MSAAATVLANLPSATTGFESTREIYTAPIECIMEGGKVLVMYVVSGAPGGPREDGQSNAFVLQTAAEGKEVLVIDILRHWEAVGRYDMLRKSMFVDLGDGRIVSLVSPSEVIPPQPSGRISLIYCSGSAAPVVPLGQPQLFWEDSQLAFFGSRVQAPATGGQRRQQQPQHQQQKEQPQQQQQQQQQARAAPSSSSAPQKKTQSATSSATPPTAATAEAVLESAKDTLGAAARSLFGFAAMAAKRAEDLANTLASGVSEYRVGHTHVRSVKLLAEGGFGSVFLVEDKKTSKPYAMKQCLCQSQEQINEAHAELHALQIFQRAEHIIQLLDHSSTQQGRLREILFLFPLYENGTCWDRIEVANRNASEDWPFSERRALKIIVGTCLGLQAMHEAGWAHCDVKPHNILLSRNGEAILTDLGSTSKSAKKIENRQQALLLEEEAARKTSAAYRAPELTQTPYPSEIDERVDVWGVGCVLYALAFGRSPFETVREGVSRLAILNGRYSLPIDFKNRDCQFSDGFVGLIESLLQVDPSQRPFSSMAIEHARQLQD